jgi:hypothetical protein
MPLHDHFREPVSRIWPWASIHSSWAHALVQQLNLGLLPSGFYALPRIHLGELAQIDVAAAEDERASLLGNGSDGGVATATWAPPRPPVVVTADFANPDIFEIEVRTEGDLRVVAAIELVSPANKDRPAKRRAFAAKCAALLQQNVGLVVVDAVTERHDNLHDELLTLLAVGEASAAVTSDLYAVAYRVLEQTQPPRLEMWPVSLQLGASLPVLPLWIGPDRALPLDLEASYQSACQSLRLR